MDVPISKIDIEYLIDAAQKIFRDEEDIPRDIPYIFFKVARKTLLSFASAEGTADLHDRIDAGFVRFPADQESPQGYEENGSIIEVILPFYRVYDDKWGTLSAHFRELEVSPETRAKIFTTSKALRTALKMLTRVERGYILEEFFIDYNEIPREFLQNTRYEERGSTETDNIIPLDGRPYLLPESSSTAAATDIQASGLNSSSTVAADIQASRVNSSSTAATDIQASHENTELRRSDFQAYMYFPWRTDFRYLINAAREISFDHDIYTRKYIAFRLYKEAEKILENEEVPAMYTNNLKSDIEDGLSKIKDKRIPECPEGYKENDSIIQVLVQFYREYNKNYGPSSAKFRELGEGKILAICKELRTALKMLYLVAQKNLPEKEFTQIEIPEEFLQDTKYDVGPVRGREKWLPIEANMYIPSKIEIEYLIDAAEKTFFEDAIPKYFPCILYYEAHKALKRFEHYSGPADLAIKFRSVYSTITVEVNNFPMRPEDYKENKSVIQDLVQLYREYIGKKKIDEIREEDEKHKKEGILNPNFQVLEGRSAMRERILTTSKALRTALKMLCRVERGDTPEVVFIQDKIPREFLQDTEYEGSNETSNIIPFDDPTNCVPAEVEDAIESLKLGIKDFPSHTQGHDVLDCLQKFFKFQESSVSNQRENIVNLLSNEQMRHGEHGTAFNKALKEVFKKTLKNYMQWCKYLPIKPIWKNTDVGAISNEKKILYISLYYLIWGEAANVRFLPECLCYIFHHMSKQLDIYLMLNSGEPNKMSEQLDKYLLKIEQDVYQDFWSLFYDSFDEEVTQLFRGLRPLYKGSFIKEVIQPLYGVIAAEAKTKKEKNVPHSKWRNYDDFNEYFWSPRCREQFGWPINVSNLQGKSSFIERRTFWHLYHSFHRMWIFHVMMFEALVIFAFNDEKLDFKTLREILTVTYFLMKLIQSMFDIWLKYGGAYSKKSRVDVMQIVFRFIGFMSATLNICFSHMKCLQEMASSIEESICFKIYTAVLGIYAVFKILFSILSQFLPKKYENSSVARLIKWINQEEFVGRGMNNDLTDIFWYMLFWLVTLGFNFAFTYYCLISPLVRPTRDITDVSKNIHNMLAIGSLWAGVICAYIVGSHVVYNVTSAVVGTYIVGRMDGLSKIKSLDDVHKCFDSIPTKFMDHLKNRESRTENNLEDVKLDAKGFSPFWNQIVMNLREEDYISDFEQYALNMPENSGSIDVIHWPPFLLVGKVFHAIRALQRAQQHTYKYLWNEISRDDVYMKYAVEECFHSIKFILHSVLKDEGKKWVDERYEDIESSIARDGNLCSEFQLNKLESFVKAISELTEILNIQKDHANANRLIYSAEQALQNVIRHDFLGKKRFGWLNISIIWPEDPELKSQIKRLHYLLTMKSATHVPRNREARRRLEFYTNSLFMSMPTTMPVRNMLSFSVLTPYYEETVLYSLDELESSNDDGVTLIDYLKNLYPDEWANYCERMKKRYMDVDRDRDRYEYRLWASYRGQTLARTVRGIMYYQKALLFQAYRETLNVRGSGVDGLTSTSPVPAVSMDKVIRAMLDSLEVTSSRDNFAIMLCDEENYNLWREQMMKMMTSEIMRGFINGLLTDPDPKGESQDVNVCNNSREWKKLDRIVKDWIMASLIDILKNMVKEMKTAKELWKTLEMFFSTDTDEISSGNVTEHVTIKLLNKDHYREWVSQMEEFLQAKGMFGYINGKLKDPDPEGKSQEKRVEIYSQRWKELDKQVKKWISDSLSESMYESVKDVKTAKQMWDALKEVIGSQCLDYAKAHVDLKFTYVVSCQIYGKQKREGNQLAADIAFLLKRNEGLRVAFIDNANDEFYSKLVKADKNGKDMEVYSIKLPGNPILGEGKPENQNHAIVFTRGNAIQTIDMNQDNYFEETLKMRNLLEEFHREPAPTILGIREHIFTGSASSLASFMSNQETGFVTLGQRVIANPLKVRMHYGHPDVFDRVFHITRGGISKASHGINISEDIYAGFNSTLRQGSVTHHEYIQVGKGRDVAFNQIATFEGKVAGGNGEQVLSRDIYRLGQRFDFFRMLSFYYTTVGYYFSSLLMVITLYILLYGNLIMALSGTRVPHVLNDIDMAPEWFLMIVLLPSIYMLLVPYLEQGLEKAVESFLAMFFSLGSIFFAFSLGTRIHWFGRTIIHGGASYQATGRGFVLHHIKFSENYRRYSRSHFLKGMEVLFLVVVYIIYGFHSARALYNNLLLLGGLILSISWIVAPFLFDSSPFDPNKNSEDWENWNNWRNCESVRVEKTRLVSVPVDESWESWWNKELSHIRTLEGRVIETILSLRFFIFPLVVGYKLDVQGLKNSLSNCGIPWICLVGILFAHEFFLKRQPEKKFFSINRVATIRALALAIIAYYYAFGDMLAFPIAIITIVWEFISLFSNNGVGTIGAFTVGYYYSAFGDKLAFIIAIITIVWGFLSFFSNNRMATIGALAIACYFSALGDMLAFIIAFITTLWGILSICVAWKPTLEIIFPLKYLAWICDIVMRALLFIISAYDDMGMLLLFLLGYVSNACEEFHLWTPVKYLAWICDTGMGALMFKIANMFSQRSIRRYLVRNMFDQNISELLHNSSADFKLQSREIYFRNMEIATTSTTSVGDSTTQITTRGRHPCKKTHVEQPLQPQEPLRSTSSSISKPPSPSINHFPKMFHDFIDMDRVQNVKGDGNCGFRAVAVGLGFQEDEWYIIRGRLMKELKENQELYVKIFGKDECKSIKDQLKFFKRTENAPQTKWMTTDMAILIASQFDVALHVIAKSGCETYLPLHSKPKPLNKHKFISLGYLNGDHYVSLFLKEGYPVPTVSQLWDSNKSPCARAWIDPYENRIANYEQLQSAVNQD